jgi:predicted ribosome quality control (RQC) complex YloA/Tae2 family protein
MAHAHNEHDRSKEIIEVEDFYSENELRKIELKPTLSIAENAEDYYDRAAKARRRIVESKRREKEIKNEIGKIENILQSLDEVNNLYELQDWEKQYEEELRELGMGGGDGQKKSTPYYITEFDGYEIRIGKNAKSNDKLTSEAHKEDIWLHARGASGSHVVIRMNNTPENPPMHIIQRAASYAAWHSKLRGSQLVPVIFTKRKYVIKSRGAPAGTVRVQREEVVMAEPRQPEKK